MLGEVVKESLTSCDGVGGLNSASGGKSPAGAALALVLDGDDVASRNPINFCRGVGNTARVLNWCGSFSRYRLVGIKAFELFFGPVRKLIVAVAGGAALGVENLDVGINSLEVLEA